MKRYNVTVNGVVYDVVVEEVAAGAAPELTACQARDISAGSRVTGEESSNSEACASDATPSTTMQNKRFITCGRQSGGQSGGS